MASRFTTSPLGRCTSAIPRAKSSNENFGCMRSASDMPDRVTFAQKVRVARWTPEQEFTFQFRPEMAAGGYARDDSTVEFYQRVMALLPDGAVILDLGAGRGGNFEIDRGPWKNSLVRLGNKCSRRVGVDIDPAV